MKRRISLIAVSLGLSLLGQAPARAETVFSFGVGGSWRPLNAAARQIRLVEQEIRVELPSRHVEVRSVFRNDGAAAIAAMGFPEHGEPRDAGRFPPGGFMNDYRPTLDGKPLKTFLLAPQNVLAGGRYEDEYDIFWTARVPFARGQTRVLRDSYTSGANCEMMGAPEAGYFQRFDFDWSGSALWKGKVSRLRALFKVGELRVFSEVSSEPKMRASGADWEFVARNFETQDKLCAKWWPGVRRFEVDGEAPIERCVVMKKAPKYGEFEAVYPRVIGGRIWVPLRLFADWLPLAGDGSAAQIRFPPRHTFADLKWGAREVFVALTSDTIDILREDLPQGEEPMSAPVFADRGVWMVELAPMVRALGGQVTMRKGVAQLWLRKVAP